MSRPEALDSPWTLAGSELPSPFFNAAGLLNHYDPKEILRLARRLANTGVGGLQAGSITLPPSPGNEAVYGSPTDYYDESTGEMTNSKGLPNPGRDEFMKIADEFIDIAHSAGKLAIISVSPTKDAGDSVEQAAGLAEDFLRTEADKVIINVSCPNIVVEGSTRKAIMGYDFETMHRLVDLLYRRVGITRRLGVKSANHLEPDQKLVVPQLAKIYRDYPVFSWMETPNTIPGHVPVGTGGEPILSVPGGAGGLSGPATAANGREQLLLWHDALGGSIDIVSTQGGTFSGRTGLATGARRRGRQLGFVLLEQP